METVKFTAKFLDAKAKIEEDVLFGTCDLCEYTGSLQYTIATFEVTPQAGKKTKVDVELGFWVWGDYFPLSFDLLDFAIYLETQTLESLPKPYGPDSYSDALFSAMQDFEREQE